MTNRVLHEKKLSDSKSASVLRVQLVSERKSFDDISTINVAVFRDWQCERHIYGRSYSISANEFNKTLEQEMKEHLAVFKRALRKKVKDKRSELKEQQRRQELFESAVTSADVGAIVGAADELHELSSN